MNFPYFWARPENFCFCVDFARVCCVNVFSYLRICCWCFRQPPITTIEEAIAANSFFTKEIKVVQVCVCVCVCVCVSVSVWTQCASSKESLFCLLIFEKIFIRSFVFVSLCDVYRATSTQPCQKQNTSSKVKSALVVRWRRISFVLCRIIFLFTDLWVLSGFSVVSLSGTFLFRTANYDCSSGACSDSFSSLFKNNNLWW